jgi:hypothetical protein
MKERTSSSSKKISNSDIFELCFPQSSSPESGSPESCLPQASFPELGLPQLSSTELCCTPPLDESFSKSVSNERKGRETSRFTILPQQDEPKSTRVIDFQDFPPPVLTKNDNPLSCLEEVENQIYDVSEFHPKESSFYPLNIERDSSDSYPNYPILRSPFSDSANQLIPNQTFNFQEQEEKSLKIQRFSSFPEQIFEILTYLCFVLILFYFIFWFVLILDILKKSNQIWNNFPC